MKIKLRKIHNVEIFFIVQKTKKNWDQSWDNFGGLVSRSISHIRSIGNEAAGVLAKLGASVCSFIKFV